FFFQAEDGIRDFHVTGVQTCALPISSATDSLDGAYVGLGYVSEDGVTEAHEDSVDNIVAWQNSTIVRAVRTASLMTLSCTLIERSEERRVGKEWRGGGAAEEEKKDRG